MNNKLPLIPYPDKVKIFQNKTDINFSEISFEKEENLKMELVHTPGPHTIDDIVNITFAVSISS